MESSKNKFSRNKSDKQNVANQTTQFDVVNTIDAILAAPSPAPVSTAFFTLAANPSNPTSAICSAIKL